MDHLVHPILDPSGYTVGSLAMLTATKDLCQSFSYPGSHAKLDPMFLRTSHIFVLSGQGVLPDTQSQWTGSKVCPFFESQPQATHP